MPDDIAIRCQHVGKRYRINAPGSASYKTFRDVLGNIARSPAALANRLRPAGSTLRGDGDDADPTTFWALKDVSFEIKRGEAVGIIGRNGAGKSTLLKVLSQITKPTRGRIEINGRVGSLLEVGTGFHPELSGRENIFLNGAILGMTRQQVKSKFDEIVDFSEVERFLDTPVKQYSSGMYTRLAFAVAAHLEPEVLVVDEVLAVGDAAFQRKCLGKMKNVVGEGRTVLFVSHNMGAIRTLCTSGIVLGAGEVEYSGDAESAIDVYLQMMVDKSRTRLADRTDRAGKGGTKMLDVRTRGLARGDGTVGISTGEPFEISFDLSTWLPGLSCRFTVYDAQGQPVFNSDSGTASPADTASEGREGNPYTLTWRSDQCLLVPGHYRLNAAISSANEVQDHVEGAIEFEVHPGAVEGRPVLPGSAYGSVTLPHRWNFEPTKADATHTPDAGDQRPGVAA